MSRLEIKTLGILFQTIQNTYLKPFHVAFQTIQNAHFSGGLSRQKKYLPPDDFRHLPVQRPAATKNVPQLRLISTKNQEKCTLNPETL